jgi:hypothetical protein
MNYKILLILNFVKINMYNLNLFLLKFYPCKANFKLCKFVYLDFKQNNFFLIIIEMNKFYKRSHNLMIYIKYNQNFTIY